MSEDHEFKIDCKGLPEPLFTKSARHAFKLAVQTPPKVGAKDAEIFLDNERISLEELQALAEQSDG